MVYDFSGDEFSGIAYLAFNFPDNLLSRVFDCWFITDRRTLEADYHDNCGFGAFTGFIAAAWVSGAVMRALFAVLLLAGCARTDIYYPLAGGFDGKEIRPAGGGRAVVLNGSDSLGNTVIEVTGGGVRFASAGGIDNSTSTREGYRTVRFGIAAAAWAAGATAVASQAAGAYGANQASVATSNVAASRASAATAASKAATTVRLAEIQAAKEAAAAAAARAIPAAGSTIPATIPAVVTPVP